MDVTSETDLRALDEEIARLRGWKLGERGWWFPESPTDGAALLGACLDRGDPRDPPPFSSDRALSMGLLEEMGAEYGDGGVVRYRDGWAAGCDVTDIGEYGDRFDGLYHGATASEAVARWWRAEHPRKRAQG